MEDSQADFFFARRKEIKAMYDGYVESEEKVEARKRRILGTATPIQALSAESNDKQVAQGRTSNRWLKRQILMMVTLYPAAFLVGNLLGKLVAALGR